MALTVSSSSSACQRLRRDSCEKGGCCTDRSAAPTSHAPHLRPAPLVRRTGGSHEGYVKWACVAAANRGWRAVVLNMRGCNGLPLTSARGYNAIITADVHVAVQSIHRCVYADRHNECQLGRSRAVEWSRVKAGSRRPCSHCGTSGLVRGVDRLLLVRADRL